jgi:hypothetical protein
MSKFAAPAPAGDQLSPAELLGHLLVICPTEYRYGIITKYNKPNDGGSEAVVIDVAVLTQQDINGQIPTYHDAMWFNVGLRITLKKQMGQLVLARMGQGEAKDGQDPPYTLVDATQDPQAVAFAEQWLASHPDFESGAIAKSRAAAGGVPVAAPATSGQPNVPIPGVPQNAQSRPATAPQVAPIPQAAAPQPAPAGPVNTPAVQPAPAASPTQIDPAVIAALPPEQQQAIMALMAQTR